MSRHWTISTGRHFQNGHHNTAKIQHCPISSKFDMWAFWKWWPVEIVQCRESIRDIIIYPHIKLWWYRTMLNFCDTLVCGEIMMSQIVSRHWTISTGCHNIAKYQHCPISSQFDHYLPTFQIVMISDNVEFLRYCGGHFENGDQ
jgi:hypothetical protein